MFLFRIAKMITGLKHINLIRNKNTHAADHYWRGWLYEKAKQMNIRQNIILLQSELVKVPVAIGYLKPMILVPLGLVSHLSPQQVETILLHELAHIKRKDYLVNLLQTIIDAIFFFNPAFIWISSLIRQERENCCDDIVIAQTNNQGDYFEALMCFQSKNFTKTYAMALGTRKQSLLHRVKRMLTRENSILTTKEIYSLLSGLVITAFCFMAFQPKPQLANLATLQFQETSLNTNSIKPEQNILSLKVDDVKKRQPLDLLSILKSDTIPQKPGKVKTGKNKAEKQKEKVRFKNIISNISDDGTNSVQQIQATSEDGTVYKLRKVAGEIESFTINGKEIAKEDYSRNYNMIISSINHEAQIRNKEATRAKHKRQQEISRRQSEMAARQARINKERKLKMDSVKRQKVNKNIQAKQRSQQSFRTSKIKQSGNSTLNAIIQDLLSSKIAQSETSLSFTLNNSELIVNGIAQSQATFEKFKSKYLKSTEDRFKYLREGNRTSTDIYIK
jgi:bla regulator protein blaR1